MLGLSCVIASAPNLLPVLQTSKSYGHFTPRCSPHTPKESVTLSSSRRQDTYPLFSFRAQATVLLLMVLKDDSESLIATGRIL